MIRCSKGAGERDDVAVEDKQMSSGVDIGDVCSVFYLFFGRK